MYIAFVSAFECRIVVRAVDVAPLRIERLAQRHRHARAAVVRVPDGRQVAPVERVDGRIGGPGGWEVIPRSCMMQ